MPGEPTTLDTEALERTLSNAQRTLDRLTDAIDEINDKAAHTLRLNVLVLGLLLTLSSLVVRGGVSDPRHVANAAFWLGTGASALSIVSAFWAYTWSRSKAGLAPADIDSTLRHEYAGDRLLYRLVLSHRHWIAESAALNRRNGRLLLASHVFLLSSLGYYALAVARGVLAPRLSALGFWGGMLAVSVLVPFAAILPGTVVWQWFASLRKTFEAG